MNEGTGMLIVEFTARELALIECAAKVQGYASSVHLVRTVLRDLLADPEFFGCKFDVEALVKDAFAEARLASQTFEIKG